MPYSVADSGHLVFSIGVRPAVCGDVHRNSICFDGGNASTHGTCEGTVWHAADSSKAVAFGAVKVSQARQEASTKPASHEREKEASCEDGQHVHGKVLRHSSAGNSITACEMMAFSGVLSIVDDCFRRTKIFECKSMMGSKWFFWPPARQDSPSNRKNIYEQVASARIAATSLPKMRLVPTKIRGLSMRATARLKMVQEIFCRILRSRAHMLRQVEKLVTKTENTSYPIRDLVHVSLLLLRTESGNYETSYRNTSGTPAVDTLSLHPTGKLVAWIPLSG